MRERTHASSDRVQVDANLTQIWAEDGSCRTCRSGWVAPLERAQATRWSIRTSSNARGPYAAAQRKRTAEVQFGPFLTRAGKNPAQRPDAF
jgi:hypothetical protein